MPKPNLDEEDLAKRWLEYKRAPSPAHEAYFARVYDYIVLAIAARHRYRVPSIIDYDDLLQAGRMGLLDAIKKYDPERRNERDPEAPNKFQTYASHRVQGAIVDSINSFDWTPRSVREKIRGVIRAVDVHYEKEQAEPSIAQIAHSQQLETEEVRTILQQRDRTHMVHMEQEVMDSVAPASDPETTERAVAIRVIMEKYLDSKENEFIQLKFFEGYNNSEIMMRMNLTPAQFKSIKDSSTRKLIEALRGYQYDN
jgi:RNA polymerase sigma factor for flagellar operon FliA